MATPEAELFQCCATGLMDRVVTLLQELEAEAGAKAVASLLNNSRAANGDTPLLVAVSHRHVALAKVLVAQGASVLIGNRRGDLPIHVAARMTAEMTGDDEEGRGVVQQLVSLLLYTDAKAVAVQNAIGDNAVHVVCSVCFKGEHHQVNLDVLFAILRVASPSAVLQTNGKGLTGLILAIQRASSDAVRLILTWLPTNASVVLVNAVVPVECTGRVRRQPEASAGRAAQARVKSGFEEVDIVAGGHAGGLDVAVAEASEWEEEQCLFTGQEVAQMLADIAELPPTDQVPRLATALSISTTLLRAGECEEEYKTIVALLLHYGAYASPKNLLQDDLPQALAMAIVSYDDRCAGLEEGVEEVVTSNRLRRLLISQVPTPYVPDKQAATCFRCKSDFNIFNRRHHCRCCGLLFCNRCTLYQTVVPAFGTKQSRVCDLCHESALSPNRFLILETKQFMAKYLKGRGMDDVVREVDADHEDGRFILPACDWEAEGSDCGDEELAKSRLKLRLLPLPSPLIASHDFGVVDCVSLHDRMKISVGYLDFVIRVSEAAQGRQFNSAKSNILPAGTLYVRRDKMSALVALQSQLLLSGVQLHHVLTSAIDLEGTLRSYLATYYRMLRCSLDYLQHMEWLKDEDDITVEALPDGIFGDA